MGRLFWKFFIFFWLAQVTTVIGVGMAIWLHSPAMAQFHAPPPAPGEVGIAPPAYLPPEGHMGPPPYNQGLLPPLVPLLAGSERTEDSMARIKQEGVRMDALVSELLTLSRLEAGMAGNLDEEVELNELVFNVVEDARFEAETSTCRIEFEECCRVTVIGNAELLHRAVENVVRNAVKHSPPDGLIAIKMHKTDAQTVCIAVSDEGPGVSGADMQSIFEPFFRSDSTKATSGHGLGLTIAHRVVAAHQGSISASNFTGGGLRVTISLPARMLT